MDARAEPEVAVRVERRVPLVAVAGNPNTGKTTLFNHLTGARARVGNYPGITVERRVGRTLLASAGEVDLVDLPGCYSLSARSREEEIAIFAVLGLGEHPRPDITVVVVDAGQLVRNLYLVLQLIELEVPLVVALNMMDEAGKSVDPKALSALLGVPVVPTTARKNEGLTALRAAIDQALRDPPLGHAKVEYPKGLLEALEPLVAALPATWRASASNGGIGRDRALALWALSSIDVDDELEGIPNSLRARCLEDQKQLGDVDLDIVAARYRFLDERVAPKALRRDDSGPTPAQKLTARVDRVVLHPFWGFLVFVAVMLVLFQALFTWANPAIGVVEDVFAWLGGQARAYLPAGFVADLVSEGLISGVGNVIVFLPQILLLFFLLGLLEDSGYMARAAYLMDRIMKSLGLHGRAFVPMLSGCACAIPAIMATRTMERERDRLLTMLVIPLMTCSARLPVYTLIIAALFPASQLFGVLPVQGLLMVGMYLFSTLMALIAAGVIGRTVVRGRSLPLLLELPPYRLPTVRSVFRQMLERAGVFLKEAGTVILVCTLVLWALLSYPKPDSPEPPAEQTEAVAAWQADKLAGSWGGQLGKTIEPAIEPLGFDWKLGVGIIGAFAAREVFVSTMGLVYGIGEANEESEPLRDKIKSEAHRDGKPVYTPLVGLSLMIFFALACQCMSTLAVVRRETKSWKWPAFLFGYMTTLAWVTSFLVYQGGKLLGLG